MGLKRVLLGIMTVHRKGLVHTGLTGHCPMIPTHTDGGVDLKMENVGVSGFDNEKPNDNKNEIIVRLSDLDAGIGLSHIFSSRGLTSDSQQARQSAYLGTDIPKPRGALWEAVG